VIRKAILGVCVLALSACAGGGPGTRAIVGVPTAQSPRAPKRFPISWSTWTRASRRWSAARSTSCRNSSATHGPARHHRRRRYGAGQHRQLQRERFSRFHDGPDLSDLHHQPAAADRARKRHAEHPPIGRLRAAGQTIQSFEALLERRLGEVLIEPSVIVELIDRQSARVNVVGQVAGGGASR
jgi:hypothetical protein